MLEKIGESLPPLAPSGPRLKLRRTIKIPFKSHPVEPLHSMEFALRNSIRNIPFKHCQKNKKKNAQHFPFLCFPKGVDSWFSPSTWGWQPTVISWGQSPPKYTCFEPVQKAQPKKNKIQSGSHCVKFFSGNPFLIFAKVQNFFFEFQAFTL